MSRSHSHLNSAVAILSKYNGSEPFSSFLKKHFAANKKFGSKDRKQVGQMCYAALRLGQSEIDLASEDRIIAGLLLTSVSSNPILLELKPEWDDQVFLPLEEKLKLTGIRFDEIFPFADELSDSIDFSKFTASFFVQPDLFLRIRPGHQREVISNLENSEIHFTRVAENSIRLPNSFNSEDYFELDKEVVVQDLNSQRVGELFAATERKPNEEIWDCCSASGGKSIMLHDIDPGLKITATDIRESILINLRKRFEQAGIKNYKSFVSDLSAPDIGIKNSFDWIIADVPCTGSGTWSRTPEQLAFFNKDLIGDYSNRQKKIVANVLPQLKSGGYLLYITCSVFKKENEEIVQLMQENYGLVLQRMEILKGYDVKADTMFVALLKKS